MPPFVGRDPSIAESDVFEPANGVALIGNDLCLPYQGDRHGAHDQGDPDVRLVNLTPQDAAQPFHGSGSTSTLRLLKQTGIAGARRCRQKLEQSERHGRTCSNAAHPAETGTLRCEPWRASRRACEICYANLPSMAQLAFRPLPFQAMLASTCSQTSREDNRNSRVRVRRCPLIPVSEVRSANKMLRSQKGKRLGARSSVATATEGA